MASRLHFFSLFATLSVAHFTPYYQVRVKFLIVIDYAIHI